METKNVAMTDRHNYTFDLLRITACVMVLLNHTNSWVFVQYFPMASGQISLVLFFFSKAGVPLFFMLSGALLLRRQDSYRIAYGKRALRIVLAILLFSVLYSCLINRNLSVFSFAFFRSLITEPIIVPYWYLYSYLSLMLLLPFLQKMVANCKQKDLTILLMVLFICGKVIPFFSVLGIPISLSAYFTANFFSGPIFYFILGYFISHYFVSWAKQGNRKWWTIVCCALLFVGGIVLCWYMTGYEYYTTGKFALKLDNIHNLPITVYSVALFIFVMVLCGEWRYPVWFSKKIRLIADSTFGVYLIHNIAIERTRNILNFLCGRWNDLFAVLIMDVILFVGCVLVITLLRRIPGVKKIL